MARPSLFVRPLTQGEMEFLAMRGVTGPFGVFEGNKGFVDAIAGPFEIDWSRQDLERVTRSVIKNYNAEVHAQSVIEAFCS
jgi:2-methylcitrate dehydratase